MKLTVVVVNYNTCDQLRRCLKSLDKEFEVIVVDNASTDGSAEMVRSEFPNATLIANEKNRGFSAANNQGLEIAEGNLVVLLNSDAYPKPGALRRLMTEFSDKAVVAAGPKLLNLDESLQESAANDLTLWVVFCEQTGLEKLFPASELLSPYWTSRHLENTSEVAQVMGACLMFRPVEKMDERYFLYCEDTDLCYRLEKHGKILYVPEAEVYHELGSSSTQDRWKSVARYNRGKELFFSIHYSKAHAFMCWLFNRMGALIRLLIWGIPTLFTLGTVERFRTQTALFWKVLTAPTAGPSNS